MASKGKSDDSKASTSEQARTKGESEEDEEQLGLGYQNIPVFTTFAAENPELLRSTPYAGVFENMMSRVKGALAAADAAVDSIRDAKVESADKPYDPEDIEAEPVECDSSSITSAHRRLKVKRDKYKSIPESDKILYESFKGSWFKGTPLFDMTGAEDKEKKLLEEWFQDSRRLLKAAVDGDYELAKELIHAGANTNAYDKEKENATVLMFASASGNTKIVAALLANRAKVNDRNLLGRTSLMEAAENGHFSVVKGLVKAGANLHATDKVNESALSLALKEGHTEIASYLELKIKQRAARSQRNLDEGGATSQSTVSPATSMAVSPPEIPSAESESDLSQADEASASKVEVAPISILSSLEQSPEGAGSSGESDQVVPDVELEESE